MTREEAYTLLGNLQAGFEAQQKQIADLEHRMKLAEDGRWSTKRTSTASVQKTNQNRLADLWIEVYKGKPPGQLFKIGSQMVRDYGWDRVEPVLRYKFRKTEIDYLSLPKIAGAFAVIEGEMRSFYGTPSPERPAAEESGQTEYAQARRWIEANGGLEKVARAMLGKAKPEDGHDRFRNALQVMGAPPQVLINLSQSGLLRGTI